MKKLIVLLVMAVFLAGCARYVKESEVAGISKQVYYQELQKAPTVQQATGIARAEAGKVLQEVGDKYVTKAFYIVDQENLGQTIKGAVGITFDIQVLKQHVYFTTASFVLDDRARKLLVAKSKILNGHPNITLTIIGRASNTAGSNNSLSLKRAVMVKNFLMSQQVSGTRLMATYKGLSDSAAHLAEDQSVTFEVAIVESGMGHPIPPEGAGMVDSFNKCAPPCKSPAKPKAPSAPKG